MSASIRIASIGLPPHERQCIDAFVAQDRRYRITLDLKRADLIIVNGDDAAAMLSRGCLGTAGRSAGRHALAGVALAQR
ncbi:MAG: hypothetical protein HZY78_08505 [Burkholderiaceae bacterium]|nr:MAG: hypothetical protein HZY78_08505 [Burkholderiaceae bacterium]